MLVRCWAFNEFDSFFFSPHYAFVQSSSVATQPSKRIQVPFLVAKHCWVEIRITIFFSYFDTIVEHPDSVTIHNGDVSFTPLRQGLIVKISLMVLEVSETLANAPALWLLFDTYATITTILNCFKHSIREFERPISVVNIVLDSWFDMGVLHDICWSIQ